jgi:ketose-bisphosphate aldolase
MPIVNNNIIMKNAREKGYGVAAFNLFNYESIAWAIEAAEMEDRPVIIMLYPPCKGLIPFHAFTAITRSLAAKATVQVGLHLDHSQSFTEIMEAVAAGFSSVMIDASRLPWDANVSLTAKVVEACHAMGVDVEAELGLVGLASNHEDFNNSAGFTKPDEAVAFIRETGADALAVAIGSAHGTYVATPKLDLARLAAIHAVSDVPLVLHGGTGIPDDQIREAVRVGISKMNVATELNQAFYAKSAQFFAGHAASSAKGSQLDFLAAIHDDMVDYFRGKIRLMSSGGSAT